MEALMRHVACRWHGHLQCSSLAQLQSLPSLASCWTHLDAIHSSAASTSADQGFEHAWHGQAPSLSPTPSDAAVPSMQGRAQPHHLPLMRPLHLQSSLITASPGTSGLSAWRCLSTSAASASNPTAEATSPSPAQIDFKFPILSNPVENKRPEDLAGRGSKLLTTYKKNLHPRQLVHRIMIRPGVNNILPLLKLYQSRLDGIAVAAVLSKTARTHALTQQEDREALVTSATETLKWLEPYARFQIRYCSVPATTGILYGWARLPPALCQVWPQEVASFLLKHVSRPPKSGDAKDHKLRKVSPRTLTVLSWSVSRLFPKDSARQDPLIQHFAATLATYASRRITHFNPSGLATLASSLTYLSPATAKQLLESHAAPDAARRIGLITEKQFQPAELIKLLRACAQVQLQHVALFEKAAGSVMPQVTSWAPAEVAALAAVFAQVLIRHEGLMQAVADTTLQRLDAFTAEQAAQVAAACRAVKCTHAELDQAVERRKV